MTEGRLIECEDLAEDPGACTPECGWRLAAKGLLREIRSRAFLTSEEMESISASLLAERNVAAALSGTQPMCQSATCEIRRAVAELRALAARNRAKQEIFDFYAATGYKDWFTERLRAACAPVYFEDSEGKQRNGSMTFVDTGTSLIGLTAKHVLEAMERACSSDNRPQVGNAHLELAWLRDRHPRLDLASFSLSADFIAKAGHKAMRARTWPPAPVGLDEVLAFGGYPGAARELRDGAFSATFLMSMAKPQVAEADRLAATMDFGTALASADERWNPETPLGGISGGTVFRIKKEPIDEPEIVGIIYSGEHTTGIVYAHPLSDLASDGTFA